MVSVSTVEGSIFCYKLLTGSGWEDAARVKSSRLSSNYSATTSIAFSISSSTPTSSFFSPTSPPRPSSSLLSSYYFDIAILWPLVKESENLDIF